jgi:hypothetical protein
MIPLQRVLKFLVTGLLLTGLVSACGSSTQPSTNIVKQKSRRKERGEIHWVVSVTGGAGVQAGKWHLDFEPLSKQVFLTTPANKPFSSGQLLTNNRIKFATLPACHNQGKPSIGMYSYHSSGNQLTLTKTGDSCTERTTVLTGHPWTKQ